MVTFLGMLLIIIYQVPRDEGNLTQKSPRHRTPSATSSTGSSSCGIWIRPWVTEVFSLPKSNLQLEAQKNSLYHFRWLFNTVVQGIFHLFCITLAPVLHCILCLSWLQQIHLNTSMRKEPGLLLSASLMQTWIRYFYAMSLCHSLCYLR